MRSANIRDREWYFEEPALRLETGGARQRALTERCPGAGRGAISRARSPRPRDVYNGSMRKATDTVLRHLAMLASIPVRPKSKSTREIREELLEKDSEFDVSVRSIQRSLEMLSAHFPIASETRGRSNYWYWIDKDALTQIPAMSQSIRVRSATCLRIPRTLDAPICVAPIGSLLPPRGRRPRQHGPWSLDGPGANRWPRSGSQTSGTFVTTCRRRSTRGCCIAGRSRWTIEARQARAPCASC